MSKPISLEEIKHVLKSLGKDKGPGLDGWTVEFSLALFKLLGKDICRLLRRLELQVQSQGL